MWEIAVSAVVIPSLSAFGLQSAMEDRMRRRSWIAPMALALASSGLACGSGNSAPDSPDGGRVDGSLHGDGGSGDSEPPRDVQGPPPPMDSGPIKAPQPVSPFIVVDQFGYRPAAEKIAVIRNPQNGFDTATHFTPGSKYALVDAHTDSNVFEAAPAPWNGGSTDMSSGDQAWAFDFSSYTTAGEYYVLDETNAVRSPVFALATSVYAPILTQAVRMYYYQRSGIAHDATYAGAGWADGMNDAQDSTCTLCPGCPGTAATKDVHGGWFDAGDQNRYTNWEAVDAIQLLRAYTQTPSVFTDDYNIPESGNGVPDILDEAKWAIDWLLRMQNSDGSVQSIAGHAGASPPSADTSPCYYGSVSTSSAYSGAAVFALASVVWKSIDASYSSQLVTAAENAWKWAQANPGVTFNNPSYNIGAGDSELDSAYGLPMREIEAAIYLFEATGTASYKTYVENNYKSAHMFSYGNYADLFEGEPQEMLLDYTKVSGASASVVSAIKSAYAAGMQSAHNFGSQSPINVDPYYGAIYTYVWGSNANKAQQGIMFQDMVTYAIDPSMNADSTRYAERYVHPFHGVNPLSLVYLSNMAGYGATKSVTRFFHTWFNHTSALWNAVGISKYGPPPGYLPGGPNPSYTWDACCPGSCSGNSCGSAVLAPPANQPSQKAYLDFNDNWPLDSWQVTEPDDGYQANYVRLLSYFLK
jgi:endoglucanase